jgi:WD40 repeat protein
VVFSPDGQHLAIGTQNGEVQLRDPETGAEIRVFKGHAGDVSNLVFVLNGARLVSKGSDGTIRVWEASPGPGGRTFGGDVEKLRSVVFSPDGKRVAACSSRWDDSVKNYVASQVKVWDLQTGQDLLSLKEDTGRVLRVAYSPDGKRLAAGYGTWDNDKGTYVAGEVKVWDAQTGRKVVTFKEHTAAVVSIAFSPDGKRIVSSSSVGDSHIGDGGDPGEPGEVKVWDAETGQELLTLQGNKRFVNSVAYSRDGKRLATLGRDNTVKVWDSQTGQVVHTLNVRSFINGDIAFSPDGKRLASSSGAPGGLPPFEIKVWDAKTAEELHVLKGHTVPATSVVFSPDGERLASGSGRPGGRSIGEVMIWDVHTGQELLTLKGAGYHDGISFSPDGHMLASDVGGKVTIYDATPLPEKP